MRAEQTLVTPLLALSPSPPLVSPTPLPPPAAAPMAPTPAPPPAEAPSPPPDVESPDADAPTPAPETDSTSPPPPDAEAPKADPPPPHLPDGIIEDILLRLPTAGDVARASAACASFRAITAPLPFRRRFRARHRAPVLGFLREDFYAARDPHPSAPAARALKLAADFAFSFLPDADCWSPRDARDGRVLFSAVPSSHGRGSFADATSTTFVDLVVADPLSRRYVRVPPVPDHLSAPVLRWGMLDFEPFLRPASADDLQDDDAPFRVIGKVLCEEKVAVFAFSSRTGEWRGHGSTELSNDFALDALYERRHYVQGCFCWLLEWMEKLLMLDSATMEFSIVDLPPGNDERRFAILEAGHGRIGLLNIGRTTLDLFHRTWPSKGDRAQEWQHKTVEHPLPDYHWRIIGSDEEYLLLRGISLDWPWFGSASSESPDIEYFALELKALQLERLYVSKHKMLHAHLYRGFPPQISAPTI